MQTEPNSRSDFITGFIPFCSSTREPVTQKILLYAFSVCRLSASLLTIAITFYANLRLYQYCRNTLYMNVAR